MFSNISRSLLLSLCVILDFFVFIITIFHIILYINLMYKNTDIVENEMFTEYVFSINVVSLSSTE